MKRSTMAVLFCIIVSGSALADQVFVREDWKPDKKEATSVGVVLKPVELFVYGYPASPKFEAGKRWLIPFNQRGSVLTGGFLSYWEQPKELYLESWSLLKQKVGTTDLYARLIGYAPLDGGHWRLCSDQMSMTWSLAKRVSAGLAADWWLADNAKPTAGAGPIINFRIGQSMLTLRALYGARQPDALRVETFCPF